jgi:hypothetical protein
MVTAADQISSLIGQICSLNARVDQDRGQAYLIPRPKADQTTGKVARLTTDLPPELHARFKTTCTIRRTRMIDEVRQFIEEWTQKHAEP